MDFVFRLQCCFFKTGHHNFHENSSVILCETLFQSCLRTSHTLCINLNLIGPVFHFKLIKNQLLQPQLPLNNRKGREEGVSLQHIIFKMLLQLFNWNVPILVGNDCWTCQEAVYTNKPPFTIMSSIFEVYGKGVTL